MVVCLIYNVTDNLGLQTAYNNNNRVCQILIHINILIRLK